MIGILSMLGAATSMDPAALKPAGRVDARFQSYNVEMVEVTGGRFWKPYRQGPPKDAQDRYAYRPPINLANRRLRMLATALGPAYIRVSGTWASATFVAQHDGQVVPAGFTTALTPTQWRGLAEFAKATGSEVVLSAPTSTGTRDPAGLWQPAQLEALLRQSRAYGIRVAGVAFMNEPNLIGATGAPAGYGVADYARDYARFVGSVRKVAPGALILGPGAVGGSTLGPIAAAGGLCTLPVSELIAASKPSVDVYTYHHYGAVSQRCATTGPLSTKFDDVRDPAWLARTDDTLRFHAAFRDEYAPGGPIWVTETAQAACGGSPWAATFADTPRYVDQLGRLARAGVAAVFHNTLAASDYALLDERDFAPRPNYWAALLWSRLIDARVLAIGSSTPTLRMYAHCLKGRSGGVAVTAINLANTPARLAFAGRAAVYTLSPVNDGRSAALNGSLLRLSAGDALPKMKAKNAIGGVDVGPGGVSFVAFPRAGSLSCQ